MAEKAVERIPRSKLRIFNNILSIIVVGLSVYLAILPLLPNVTYTVNKAINNKHPLVRVNTPGEAQTPTVQAPKNNTLVIPSINMQEDIWDGNTTATLSKGVWHRPLSSSPDKSDNTVLVGHRYTYSGAGVFYHLDKIQQGDNIYVYWQGKKYTYKVSEVSVVPPQDSEVEAHKAEATLTLYTCTPLWSFTDRLVVVAREMTQG